jgi:hypothetical protein
VSWQHPLGREAPFAQGVDILRCDQAAIESAKETVLEIIGRPLYDQLRVEAMWGYALCGGNATVMERSQQFFDKVDRGRAGATSTPL